MKRNTLKTSFIVAVFVALGCFILNPALAVSGCYVGGVGVWYGDYEIRTAADLQALSGYTLVTGDLSILSSPLTSLKGLECLTQVESLVIDGNHYLVSLVGLESLESVESLAIKYNDSLTSLAGLENLKSVGGRLYIGPNPSLTSLAGLGNLKSVGGSLYIGPNPSLTSLAGLENLKSVGGRLYIGPNPSLTSLAGIGSLNSVGSLYIGPNSSPNKPRRP
jgi:hypothetical protein